MALISLNIGELAPASVPAMTQAPATHQPLDISELGATGTPIFGGFLRELGEYNPELTGLSAYRHYERMRRGDGQVKATLAAVKLPIRAAEWTVQAPDKPTPIEQEAVDLVKSCLLDELDFDGIVENALLMLDFGAAVHEDIWYIDGNQVRLKKCAARLPLTFYRWLTEPNGDDLAALEQMGYRGSEYLVTQIPVDKLSLFTFQQEGSNFTGISLLRSMYQHWYIKSNLYKIEAIAHERNGMGIPWIKMAAGNIGVEDRKAARDWLQQLSVNEATSILLPPDWEFGLEGVKGTIQSPKDAIEHHNAMISMAALAAFITMGTGGKSSGNRSLGQTMSDFFYLSLQSCANQIARVINLSTVKRLVDYNFSGIERYPQIAPQNILAVKFEAIVESLSKLAASGVDAIQPDDDLEAWLRKKIGMPAAGNPRPRPSSGGDGSNPAGGSSSGSAGLSETFTPKRAPRGVEKFMRLSEIASELDNGRDAIAAALRAARPRIQAEILQKLMSKPLKDAHRVSVAPDAKLVAQIQNVLEGVQTYGLKTVGDERVRQSKGAKTPTAAIVRAAQAREPLGVYADGVVSEFTNNLQQRATNVVLDQRRRPGDRTTGEQIIQAGQDLDDQSDGWIDNAAAKGTNEAFADGRREGYDNYADEISSCIYSALLDPNTCDQCSDADGDEGATPDDITDVPNPDCDGGDKCRCVHVFVFEDEGKKAA
ncbi:MAG TPA: hypothetical protein VG273_11865 [Bryobacteraceae bacterium]|jgi:phage gp29-like protein|nr:hypothetical protein [Bryobacteraceae bacterium]